MDAVVFYNQLRKAGVGLHTCAEGAIDLDSFTSQLLLFVNQKASKDYLVELSAKSLRGKIANAKRGGWNGGPAHYGLDRALFHDDGRLVRRLLPGEYIHMAGHHVRLVPSPDPVKVEAIRHAFNRADTADLTLRQLAREMDAKGYPGPAGKGWTHKAVTRLLTYRAYAGNSQWGKAARSDYHEVHGEDIVPITNNNKGKRRWRRKPQEDAIAVDGTHEGIIDPELFARVQSKVQRHKGHRRGGIRTEYPFSGLIYCEHCGKTMEGNTRRLRDGAGALTYEHAQYLCGTYSKFGPDGKNNTTCGHHTIDAEQVLEWLVYALQETFVGPGRDVLVSEIKAQLEAETKSVSSDTSRLVKRSAELDREVGRLVKAIRCIDAAELVEELAIVRAERDRVKAELTRAGSLTNPLDLDKEAERLADTMLDLGERLTDADPAVLREALRQFVSRIDCRWNQEQRKDGKLRCRFSEGTVRLRPQTPFPNYGAVGRASRHRPTPVCLRWFPRLSRMCTSRRPDRPRPVSVVLIARTSRESAAGRRSAR